MSFLSFFYILVFAFIGCSCSVLSASKTSGREVILDHKRLYELPYDLYFDTSITKISLFGNKLTTLDAQLANLQNLEVLYLGKNDFEKFPEVICQLSNLRILSLQHNEIDSIPDCICHLTKLERLFLNTNKLTYVSDSLGELRNLQVVNLSRNFLRFLPEQIVFNSSLEQLDLSYNDLDKLPDSMHFLTGLRDLNLHYAGALLQVPESACKLRFLERVKADPSIVFPMCLLTQQTNRLIVYIEP